MLRTINTAERRLTPNGGAPIVVAAAKSVDVLPDQTILPNTEIAYRYIQNVGANPLYYAFGQDASPVNFHGILAAGGAVDANGYAAGNQLDCSAHRLRVSVYSVGGSSVAALWLTRADLVQEDVFIKSQIQ